jgi:RHS repeat-associated protein
MLIHSHLPYDQSTSHARIPAGGIDLIASIDSVSEAQFTASFFGSTKALHGEVATTSPATTTHNHSNQQYSITAVTTSAGAIAERYAYSAYGEPTILDASGSAIGSSSAINNRYSYTGREWDATVGLYHFRARWMSPKSGRFLGRDPIGYFEELLLYQCGFVLSGSDPTGLVTCTLSGTMFGPVSSPTAAGAGYGVGISGATNPSPANLDILWHLSCEQVQPVTYIYTCKCPCSAPITVTVPGQRSRRLDNVFITGGVITTGVSATVGPRTGGVGISYWTIDPSDQNRANTQCQNRGLSWPAWGKVTAPTKTYDCPNTYYWF